MPAGLRRYYGADDMHFITCSCFRRRPLLDDSARRTLFLEILEEVRQKHRFVVAAYVVMPEHFHLLVSEPEQDDLSLVMQVLKQRRVAHHSAFTPTAGGENLGAPSFRVLCERVGGPVHGHAGSTLNETPPQKTFPQPL